MKNEKTVSTIDAGPHIAVQQIIASKATLPF